MDKANGGAGKENLSGLVGSAKHKVENPYGLENLNDYSAMIGSSAHPVDHETDIITEFKSINPMGGRALDTPPATETPPPPAVVQNPVGGAAVDLADYDVDIAPKRIGRVMGSRRI